MTADQDRFTVVPAEEDTYPADMPTYVLAADDPYSPGVLRTLAAVKLATEADDAEALYELADFMEAWAARNPREQV